MTKPWGSSSLGFFPLMPGTLRALLGSFDQQMHLRKIDELDPSYFLIKGLVDSKLVSKLDDDKLVDTLS